jgi:uncharacterized protein YbaR (Trm112 family)
LEIKATQYSNFANILANDVLDKLKGQHKKFERFESFDKPSKSIFIGTLGDVVEDKQITSNNKSDVKNNSLSLKFLLKDIQDDVSVIPKLSVYYRVYPTYEEQIEYLDLDNYEKNDSIPLAHIWVRKDLEFKPLSLALENDEQFLDFENIISEIKNEPEFYGLGVEIPFESLESEENFNKAIQVLKDKKTEPNLNWECKIYVEKENFSQNKKDLNLIEVGMVNETKENFRYETFLFNCQLEISLNNNEIVPFSYDYSYENKLESYQSDLRCLNCHADLIRSQNKILTESYADFKQPKIVPKSSIEGVDLGFEVLSKEEGIQELEKLHDLMLKHYEKCQKSKLASDSDYDKSLNDFFEMQIRFKKGVKLLKSNEKAFEAFKLMNESFLLNSKKYKTWRIFQIVFIVSLIPEIVDKSLERDTCELLHVMTGGGKSEAYFGIVVFSAFFDRITGKEFGVTALTKFPLRMLSIQQLQRIANLFIWAEEIRLKENLGGEPFSIAYFVGESDEFPNSNRKIVESIKKAKKKNEEIKGKIIDVCPICKGNIILDVESESSIVLHKCKDCGRIYRLLFSDDEIYRVIPTFIISTVDKLAGIATNRRFKNLLGGKIDECPQGHGFIPRNDACVYEKGPRDRCGEFGSHVNVSFNTNPTLIIQDEMHLIKEGFGTIDSHFESLFEAMIKEFSGERFKNIGMTATVTGAKIQIEHLYHKDIRIFPCKLNDDDENDFFFEYVKENDIQTIQRQVIGLKSNTRDNRVVLLFAMRYISEFIKKVEESLSEFALYHEFNEKELSQIVQSYKKFLTYHNKKADVHSTNFFFDDLVNSKPNLYYIESLPLTGDNDLEYIKNAINTVNHFYDDPIKKEKLLAVNATSIVSHGVDIDEWNIMLFDGMPRSTAEYIQALSRVGRKYPGLVFLGFISNRTRDLSFYQNFNEYHDILEHKVENVPLSRWAKLGFKQTFTSIFTASILNYLSNELERPIYNVPQFLEVFSEPKNVNSVIKFIKRAYISNSDMLGSEYFEKQIKKEVIERIEVLQKYGGNETYFFPNALKDNDNKYYKTQYGMRGIQDEIVISPNFNDFNFIARKRRK